MREADIIQAIEETLRLQKEATVKASPQDLDSKWCFLVSSEPKRFINDDCTTKKEILRNFRKYTVFVPDEPTYNPSLLNPRNLVSGRRRGIRKLLKECMGVIREQGYDSYLKKYPCSPVGNPYTLTYDGRTFNYRWTKHIYSLGLFNKTIGTKIGNSFVHLDVGSSYGIFSYLLKNEYPKMTTVLLDFPEQLILSHYFLGCSFPKAKIASFKELQGIESIDRNFLKQYDIVLIPWFFYPKLKAGSIDLVTNFASFGEMKKKWFEYYVKSEPFLSARYLFTENRFQSAPTYDSELTILDYPLHDFNKIHFQICPIFSHTYSGKYFFMSEKVYFSSQYFEFAGERPQK